MQTPCTLNKNCVLSLGSLAALKASYVSNKLTLSQQWFQIIDQLSVLKYPGYSSSPVSSFNLICPNNSLS